MAYRAIPQFCVWITELKQTALVYGRRYQHNSWECSEFLSGFLGSFAAKKARPSVSHFVSFGQIGLDGPHIDVPSTKPLVMVAFCHERRGESAPGVPFCSIPRIRLRCSICSIPPQLPAEPPKEGRRDAVRSACF